MSDEQLIERAKGWTESDLRKFPTATLELIDSLVLRVLEARKEAFKEALEIAQRTPFRPHAENDINFHSGCKQTRERIVAALEQALAADMLMAKGRS